MSENVEEVGGTGPSHRGVELGVGAFLALLALIGIYGSIKVGIGWASDGPRAGFFPFYVCLIILFSCAVNIVQVLMEAPDGRVFAYWSQLTQVGSVLLPTCSPASASPRKPCSGENILLIWIPAFNSVSTRWVLPTMAV